MGKVVYDIDVAKKKMDVSAVLTSFKISAAQSSSCKVSTSTGLTLTGAILEIGFSLENKCNLSYNLKCDLDTKDKNAWLESAKKLFVKPKLTKKQDDTVATKDVINEDYKFPDLKDNDNKSLCKKTILKSKDCLAWVSLANIKIEQSSSQARKNFPVCVLLANFLPVVGLIAPCVRNNNAYDFFMSDDIEKSTDNSSSKIQEVIQNELSGTHEKVLLNVKNKEGDINGLPKLIIKKSDGVDIIVASKYEYQKQKEGSGINSVWRIQIIADLEVKYNDISYKSSNVLLASKYLPTDKCCDIESLQKVLDKYLINTSIKLSSADQKEITADLACILINEKNIIKLKPYIDLDKQSSSENLSQEKIDSYTLSITNSKDNVNNSCININLQPKDTSEQIYNINKYKPANVQFAQFTQSDKAKNKKVQNIDYVIVYDSNLNVISGIKTLGQIFSDGNSKIKLVQKNVLGTPSKNTQYILEYGIQVDRSEDPKYFKYTKSFSMDDLSISRKIENEKTIYRLTVSSPTTKDIWLNEQKKESFIEVTSINELIGKVFTITYKKDEDYIYGFISIYYSEIDNTFVCQEVPVLNQTMYYQLKNFHTGKNLNLSQKQAALFTGSVAAIGIPMVAALFSLISFDKGINFTTKNSEIVLSTTKDLAKKKPEDSIDIENSQNSASLKITKSAISLFAESSNKIGMNIKETGNDGTFIRQNADKIEIYVEGVNVATIKDGSTTVTFSGVKLTLSDNGLVLNKGGELLNVNDNEMKIFAGKHIFNK